MKEKKSDKLHIGILYLCVHNKLIQRFGENREVERKTIVRVLGETFHIDKEFRETVLIEMEKYGMVQRISRDIILIKNKLTDPEKNVKQFLIQIGLF